MTGDRARRTSSGRTLRLVASDGETTATAPEREDADVVGVPPDVDVDSILLPGERQSVAIGRQWVVRTAATRGAVGMTNQVLELLSSELLANAVLHGPSETGIGLQVVVTEEVARVSVSDGAESSPVVMRTDPAALSGRGMAIVEAMSSRWGVEIHEDGGKTVWFELDLDDF
ncbi:ATP-binding protein [Actinotalea sp. Marseille-Q4924]|uniref:ATP-binding protein n=1 Tax=Actinotalea sp. Marseille-Q4924 TaxID=2866571 RepID=UPI001CE4104D|nr:ATP-binding protein [Actinotalea sp. Marseille-Q4924]